MLLSKKSYNPCIHWCFDGFDKEKSGLAQSLATKHSVLSWIVPFQSNSSSGIVKMLILYKPKLLKQMQYRFNDFKNLRKMESLKKLL